MRRSRATGDRPARIGHSSIVRAALSFATVAAVVLSLSSCASKPTVAPGNEFSCLGDGASAYFFVPVEENRELASLVAGSASGDGLNAALDRTRIVYGASYPDGEIRMIARGDYPGSLSRLAFPRSKGWKKTTAKGIGSWFSRDGVDAAIPQSGLACIVRAAQRTALGSQTAAPRGIETVLAGLQKPGVAPVPVNFEASANEGSAGGVYMFIADAKPWITRLLGPDVTLPVDSALVSAFPETGDAETGYAVSVSVTAKDDRTARAMLMIMRLAFPQCDVVADGRELSIKGISVSASTLVDFAGNLYF